MQRRRPSDPLLWAFLPYAAASAAHVALLSVGSPAAGPTKLLLMPLLAVPVFVSVGRAAERSALALTIAALLFSWLGDSAGVFFPAAPEVPLMLLFFGIAHLAYIALFMRRLAARRMPWWALVYAAWWVAMLVFIGPHAGGLLIAVAVYGLVLASTAATATRCSGLVSIGGAFFLASDTLLALRLFLPGSLPDWSSPAIMATYTLGQGLIIAGTLIALRKRDI
ncbi:MAG: lysoplasmalogenase family protein [Microbacterium sp.]|uniref:lysoplasmalogenase family protein n=1 Tax=Microbacterium sp. TaxID=51671 RepID=UPI003D6E6B0F